MGLDVYAAFFLTEMDYGINSIFVLTTVQYCYILFAKGGAS